MRKINVFQSQTSEIQEIQAPNGVTWGEVRDQISFDLNNKKVVVQETSVTLDLDEARLPDGEITLFVIVARSKAGNGVDYATKEGAGRIKEMAGNNLRRKVRQLNDKENAGIDTTLSTEEQRAALLEYFGHGKKKIKKAKKVKTLKEAESEPIKEEKAVDISTEPIEGLVKSDKPDSKPGKISVEFDIPIADQQKLIDKLDNISDKMDDAISTLETLPDIIAEKIKETRKVVKVAHELKAQADRIKRQLGL